MHKVVRSINCLIEFLDGASVIGAAQRKGLIGELPELVDLVKEVLQRELPIVHFRTPSFTALPSKAIVFLADARRSTPVASFRIHPISWRFSEARFREAFDAFNSSRSC
jgi:hypothetical protein